MQDVGNVLKHTANKVNVIFYMYKGLDQISLKIIKSLIQEVYREKKQNINFHGTPFQYFHKYYVSVSILNCCYILGPLN